MTYELKIKAKHLAEEARIIRFEEKKTKQRAKKAREAQRHDVADQMSSQIRSLHHHRTWDVRNECRAAQLARAYLAGKPYASVEQKRVDHKWFAFAHYVVPRVVKLVNKYGNEEVTKEQIAKWADL